MDIDDIFVGASRLLSSDVDAMLASQARLGETIEGFRLGYLILQIYS